MKLNRLSGTACAPIIIAALAVALQAKMVYVANTGLDTRTGLSDTTAWQTLAYAAAHTTSGDKILLKRGDIFRESALSLPGGVSLGAFGTGALPVVSGAVAVTGWTSWSGHPGISYASVNSAIVNLFVDGTLMRIARYPNRGWLRTTANDNASRVVGCSGLAANPRNLDNYWNGCRMRWRHWNWYFDIRMITSYTANGTMTLAGTPIQGVGNGAKDWGFYLDGKLTELDTAGEWFYDATAQRVYLYPPAGVTLSNALVEGMTARAGLTVSGATVRDIAFRHFFMTGLSVNQKSTIDRCRFEGIGSDSGGSALSLTWNSSGSAITNCVLADNLNNSISIVKDPANRTASTIEYDTILRSGCVAGYGVRGSWHAVGIVQPVGNNVRIRHCRIDSTGYAGIIFGAPGNTAEFNVIRHAMATLVDGAGIYTNCDSSTIRHNIILNTIGCWDGSPFLLEGGNGIWPEFLEHFKGQRIEYNTCAYAEHGNGIFLPNNFRSVIRGNVCYDNAQGMHIEGGFYTDDNLPMYDSIVGNVFYTLKADRVALSYRPDYSYGTIDGNYYCNPNSDNVICQFGPVTGSKWTCTAHPLSWWAGNWTQYDRNAKTDLIKRPAGAQGGDARGTSKLLFNDAEQTAQVPIGDNGIYLTLDNKEVSGSVSLEPYTSIVLVHSGKISSAVDRYRTLGGIGGIKVFLVQKGRGLLISLPVPITAATMTITVTDSRGRTVFGENGEIAGNHRVRWNPRKALASGIYLIALELRSGRKVSGIKVPVLIGAYHNR